MISQETPESFRSAHQNGKETVTMTRLRDFLFMAPVDILANQGMTQMSALASMKPRRLQGSAGNPGQRSGQGWLNFVRFEGGHKKIAFNS